MSDLKPCQFCGSNIVIPKDDDGYYVECCDCGARIGRCENRDEAIETWNLAMGATDINVGDKNLER